MATREIIDIEARRRAAGITVTALVTAAPVARSTYDRWVAGATAPNLASLDKVRVALERLERQVSEKGYPHDCSAAQTGS